MSLILFSGVIVTSSFLGSLLYKDSLVLERKLYVNNGRDYKSIVLPRSLRATLDREND